MKKKKNLKIVQDQAVLGQFDTTMQSLGGFFLLWKL